MGVGVLNAMTIRVNKFILLKWMKKEDYAFIILLFNQ